MKNTKQRCKWFVLGVFTDLGNWQRKCTAHHPRDNCIADLFEAKQRV